LDVAAWLRGLGLERYAAAFAENAVDGELLPTLTADDLKDLGVEIVGHRRKILNAIAALAAPAAPPAAARSAERRQLTVMLVDLVGSTELSGRLDPEELAELLKVYQNTVTGEVTRLEGHVAKLMGDGLLAYFGWPRAHEDEAERAVRAGLAIAQAVARLEGAGSPLACRVGIATGLVVVGELVGAAEAQERAVVGETPNLAARLQALAQPGQVVVAEGTRRLLGAGFELADLGPQTIKGLAQPVEAWAVRGERAVASRFEARSGPALRPMVGREQELALLRERWARATAGEGHAVLLVGEAGIGKSRITRALIDSLAEEPHTRVRYQGSPYHTDSAFWPVVEQLRRAAGLGPSQPLGERLDRLEAMCGAALDEPRRTAALLAPLLGIDGAARYGPLELSPQALRTRTLGCLADLLCGLTARRPVLWVVEDAHWLDPSTLDLVELCLDRIAALPVLAVLTSRPDNQPRLAAHPHVTRLTLNRLGRGRVEAIIARLSGGTVLPAALVDTIVARTDGVPLFVEELTKAVLESGDATVPASLHDSLMARLDRIPEVKAVAQIAAVIGRVFDYAPLAAIADRPAEELTAALDRLAAAELVFRRGTPPDARYTFKHALVRDAAYHSLLNERRRGLHRRLADHLQSAGGAPVEPALLAHHLEGAGQLAEATEWYRIAGHQAFARSANAEAMGHFRAALRVLAQTPGLPDARARELDLLLALGRATIAARSYAADEAAEAFGRARRLCDADTDRTLLLKVLTGEFLFNLNRGWHRDADAIADTILRLGAEAGFLDARVIGLRASGMCAFWMGRVTEARAELEMLMDLCEARDVAELGMGYGYDPHVSGAAYLALVLIVLGYPDEALRRTSLAIDLASKSAHIHSRAHGFVASAVAWHVGGHGARQLELARAARALSEEQGFEYLLAFATMLEASAVVRTGGDAAAARDLVERGFAAWEATGTVLLRPLHLTMLAEIHFAGGDDERAVREVAEALTVAERLRECWLLPEIHRLAAKLALRRRDPAEAERSLRQALAAARATEARLFELRAARDLARLWAERGERRKALDHLAPVHAWFTEGFDTPDLIEAKALLDSLA
jgi:class 3 adenylate cyclase/tetratricopeptide (TPR) repeat protein